MEDDADALFELREWMSARDLDALRARLRAWESRRSPDGAVARRAGFVRTNRTRGGEAVWEHTS